MCLAIPGQIVSLIDNPAHGALVDIVGVRRKVDVSLVEPDGIAPGDWVLIHVGFAMSKINEHDAIDQMRMLTALGEAHAAIEEVTGYLDDDAQSSAATTRPTGGSAADQGVRPTDTPPKERPYEVH